ncbi:MAG: mechanosensitive ion channel family protein [Alistipes sp.]|nr:mechanosensitive ion channel family protein [Alistipes sp.]
MDYQSYLPQVIATVVIIILLWLSKTVTGKLVNKYGSLLQKSEIRRKQTKQVIDIILNIVCIIVIAVIWGVKSNNLWVAISSLLAILGVALFAQWSVLSNVTAGVIMFFGAPYRIGDEITIIDKDTPIDATIEHIHAFYTHIRTSDHRLIVIPNNLFLQKIVSIKNQ